MSAIERGPLLRAARPDDAEGIAEIYAEAVMRGGATLDTQALPPSAFAAVCGDTDVELFVSVAEGAGRVTGWGRVQPWSRKGGYAHTGELSIFVAEQYWRQGYARALLDIMRSPQLGPRSCVTSSRGSFARTSLRSRCSSRRLVLSASAYSARLVGSVTPGSTS